MIHKLVFIFLALFPVVIYAAGDTVQVQLNVEGCNNNSICEAVIGEDQLSCPNDCTVTNAGGGNTSASFPVPSIVGFFQNVLVVNNENKVTITWQSDVPTLSVIRWGLSQDFRDGSIASTEFVKDHRVDLTNLLPGTIYYFTVDSRDAYGRSVSLPYRVIFTLPVPDTMPPQNPSSFNALSTDKGILLHWVNPTDTDFTSIRLTRNTDRYHASPFDGQLLYEGKGRSFLDTDVSPSVTYYYAIFAKDRNGNYSTGAITTGRYSISAKPEVPEKPQQPPAVEPPIVIPPSVQVQQTIPFEKFSIMQGNGVQLSISSTELPQDVSDVWVSVLGPAGGISGQYLFSYNSKKGSYTASIPATVPGTVKVYIMAYRQGSVIRISEGTVTMSSVATEQTGIIFPDVTKLLSIGTPLLLLALLLLFRRQLFGQK